MASTWRPDEDVLISDSEDEEDPLKRDFRGREAMLFVIDASLQSDKERLMTALETVRSAFISGLLVNDKDLLGLLFTNTEHSPEPYEPGCLMSISVPDNCAVFLPVRQLTKAIVEHLMVFISTAENDFAENYGFAGNGGGSFANTMRLCINLFDECGYLLNNATIVYLTDRETPHTVDSREFQMALQKAKDLEGREIEFHIIPMVDEFNYELFYKEFMSLVRDIELDSFQAQDPQVLREKLTDRKLRQDFLKRCLSHFKFSLGPNLELAAQLYNYYKNQCYPRKVKLLRKDNSIVQQKQTIMVRKLNAETMEVQEEYKIKTTAGWYEINMGSMSIRISPMQMTHVQNLHAPAMMLLGFKPKSALPKNMYYKPCNFMYPDEESIVGSKRLFRALWERCLEREKIAVCLYMSRRRSMPRYVALVPVQAQQTEESQDSGESGNVYRTLLSGDGFKIIYLPMAKCIRNNDFTDWNSTENAAPEEGVKVFQKIIRKLRIEYQPSLINDPTLEQLQTNLLALALNIKTEGADGTDMPNPEMQDARLASLLPQVEEIFGTDVEVVKKRPASGAAAGASAAKVAKITDDDIKSYSKIEELVANKGLATCTVAQLRYILDTHFGVKLPKTTSKQGQIDRIYELHTEI